MHRDPSDLGSVILFRIIPKERTLDQHERKNRRKSAFSLYCSAKQLKCNLRILAFAPTKPPFHLLGFPFRRSLEATFLVSRVLGSLSTRVFETRTATGSELFSLLTCFYTTTFTLLSIFGPLQMISIKSGRHHCPGTRNVLFRLPSASQKRACLSSLLTLRLPQRRMMWHRRRSVEPKRVL